MRYQSDDESIFWAAIAVLVIACVVWYAVIPGAIAVGQFVLWCLEPLWAWFPLSDSNADSRIQSAVSYR